MARSLLVRVVLVLAPIAMQGAAAGAKAADPCAEDSSVYDELRDAENCAQFVGLVDPQQSQEQVVTDAIAICKRKLVRIYEAGYRVSPALIERVRSGTWNPDHDEKDREHRDALAARGYWLAYQEVQKSLGKVLRGENPGAVADEDHGTWYTELFAPSVTAGLLRRGDLAGYRNAPVFIRRSKHVPMRADAVRDAMPVFFEMLAAENDPAVRSCSVTSSSSTSIPTWTVTAAPADFL